MSEEIFMRQQQAYQNVIDEQIFLQDMGVSFMFSEQMLPFERRALVAIYYNREQKRQEEMERARKDR